MLGGCVDTEFQLTQAAPLDENNNWTASSLTDILTKHCVDISCYGQGMAYTLQDLLEELNGGSSVLMHRRNRLIRVTDVVLVRIYSGGKVLVEAKSTLKDGREVVRNRLPGTKRRPTENFWRAARRLVDSMPEIRDRVVLVFGDEETEVETQESMSYPGIQSVYRKATVRGTLKM